MKHDFYLNRNGLGLCRSMSIQHHDNRTLFFFFHHFHKKKKMIIEIEECCVVDHVEFTSCKSVFACFQEFTYFWGDSSIVGWQNHLHYQFLKSAIFFFFLVEKNSTV